MTRRSNNSKRPLTDLVSRVERNEDDIQSLFSKVDQVDDKIESKIGGIYKMVIATLGTVVVQAIGIIIALVIAYVTGKFGGS